MNKLRPYLFYTIDALLIGSIVGIIDTIFGRLLLEIGELRSDYLSPISIKPMEARVKKEWSSSLK